MSEMVDWELAVTVGGRLAGPGPVVPPEEAAAAVAELRAGADRSTGLVRDFTGLAAAERTAPVLVVDRPGWVRANAEAFSIMLEPVIAKLQERKGAPTGLTQVVGSRVTGGEVGLLLGFLAGKVLGQFDPFHEPSGRLLLVAPNIVHVERELGVDPTDFRLWVCLHEETHRVQFTAVPWLRQHLLDQAQSLATDLAPDPAALLGQLEDIARRLPGVLRGEGGSLLDLLTTPEQRERVAKVTAVMSLLEGHADVVMDEVGPSVVPTVATIRARFTERRAGANAADRLLRRLLGLEDKMRQYKDGARFVRGVVDQVGMAGFNAVWTSPETLPAPREIEDPQAWVRRVHG
jgi:coenzyme F420 biosynthesis associated uncharacterized protein